MWKLIVGIVLVVLSIVSCVVSIFRTPQNLRGFYGKMLFVGCLVGVLGGAALIVAYFVA